jgi:hypothetical protein
MSLFLLFSGKIFQQLNLEWYRRQKLLAGTHRKKIAKFLMRTFTCRSAFLYVQYSTLQYTGPVVGTHLTTTNLWSRSVSAANNRISPADPDDDVLTSELVHLLRPPSASEDSPSLRAMSFALGFKNLKILSRHWYGNTRFLCNRTLSVDII